MDIGNSSVSQSKSTSVIDLFVIKVSTQVASSSRIPFARSICYRRFYTTLLKALVILRESSDAILPFICQTVYT